MGGVRLSTNIERVIPPAVVFHTARVHGAHAPAPLTRAARCASVILAEGPVLGYRRICLWFLPRKGCPHRRSTACGDVDDVPTESEPLDCKV